ncbi:MAG: hypothetical protein AB7O59_02470 [Pirellulales bacterium]
MSAERTVPSLPAILPELLGYLNFSSGKPDAQFLRNLNEAYALLEAESLAGSLASADSEPTYRRLGQRLERQLSEAAGKSAAFRDVSQARDVLKLVFDELPGRYRDFHRDLLFHQSDAAIWGPLFLGRACEAVLAQGGPWTETDRVLDGAIARLNDFLGHRPVAVLRSAQRIEPYPHERIRPLPLAIRDVGVAVGPYQPIVRAALDILRRTDPALLRDAYFDPELLDELALDPRAYDFDHPVNKRPNYHFGQWDPHHLDNQGRYRRFVLQQVTLDVLVSRVAQPDELSADELLLEAAAVLAGTMLMASGTSGSGIGAHDSATTLGTLLPKIAVNRDAFYESFIAGVAGPHGDRLRAEAARGKQPLAGARQHLNQQLARRRASQVEHVHLALLFARMGFPEAARRQANVVPVASARMLCEMQCRLSTGHRAIDVGRLEEAAAMLLEIDDLLHRAIECGALVDPWNILGFQGQFSLFPSPENSVPDHRVDQLVELLEQIVGLYARLWSEAASRAQKRLADDLARRMKALTDWWDQFAPTSVESIESFSGADAYDSAREVAAALAAFHRAGAAAGDINFWRKQVAHFQSPKAYSLAVGALLEKPDLVAAMALLMQWLSQAGIIALEQGEYSLPALAQRWLADVCSGDGAASAALEPGQRSTLVRRFLELFEANAEDFWQVPTLELLGGRPANGTTNGGRSERGPAGDADRAADEDDEDDEDDDENLYRAAYDEVVYVDSTADGVDADMLEAGGPAVTDFELDAEARRVGERLKLLRTVAWLWKTAAVRCGPLTTNGLPAAVIEQWLAQAEANQRQLVELLANVDARRIPAPSASRDSLLEYDRRRAVKDALVDKVAATVIESADAARTLRAVLPRPAAPPPAVESATDGALIEDVLRAALAGDPATVRQHWPALVAYLRTQPILYVPLAKGGSPARVAQARALQQALRDLVAWLPRLGLLAETCQLMETARLMESDHSVGSGAISEYDRLFIGGYEALVEALVDISAGWTDAGGAEKVDALLIECLEQPTEALLRQWLAHSRTLRLSVLERITSEKSWKSLVEFIERYGRDLFTQRFLHLGNLRAILHQGVEPWLAQLEADRNDDEPLLLLQELDQKIPRAEAVKHLSFVIEAIVENYAEYRDYNSTTTQSDRGDLLYTLLDFLRLRVHYDRVAWHLKPVLAAHAILVRRERTGAAETWRRALAERTAELADTLQNRYQKLREKYAMRLPTVGDRVAERFIRPLAIDRVRALVKPAMDEARGESRSVIAACGGAEPQEVTGPSAFSLLEQEADDMAQEPTGVGLEVPAWIIALEQEVEQIQRGAVSGDRADGVRQLLPQKPLSVEEVQRQLSGWEPSLR